MKIDRLLFQALVILDFRIQLKHLNVLASRAAEHDQSLPLNQTLNSMPKRIT